jgi:predicted nucleotidyltransferase
MDTLARVVGSRIRSKLFGLLFAGANDELHIREIQRRTGFNDRAIREELLKLARIGLVTSRRDGNRLYYSAHRGHPLYADIRNMALKTIALVDVLREALTTDDIAVAFVFGSTARESEKAASDVDLMVIGSLGLRELTRLLSGVSEKVGREINPHVLTKTDFRRKVQGRDHFVSGVLSEPKLFVKGDERDLRAMAQ